MIVSQFFQFFVEKISIVAFPVAQHGNVGIADRPINDMHFAVVINGARIEKPLWIPNIYELPAR